MLGNMHFNKQSCTKYGAGQKKAMYQKAFTGMHARVFVNKDSPDYQPSYGSQFTERQKKILSEEISLDHVRVNELTIIIRKAQAMDDMETAAAAQILYNRKTHVDGFHFSMTPEEAKAFLQSQTPWEINWGTQK